MRLSSTIDRKLSDYWWRVWKDCIWHIVIICFEGTLISIALTIELLTALIKFQSRVGVTLVVVRRDEHFKTEKKIVKFYIAIFAVCSCMIAIDLVNRFTYGYNCNKVCETMFVVEFMRDIAITTIFFQAVFRLFKNSRKRCYYLYRKYRTICIIQSVFVAISISFSLIVNIWRL